MTRMELHRSPVVFLLVFMEMMLFSCSTVSRLPEDELLYTGTRDVTVEDIEASPLAGKAVSEAKVAFASPPNNALFGSSRYRSPLPLGLWAYNAFVGDTTGLRRWLFRTFAVNPIYISTVNPELRAEVAGNTLRNYGYFDNAVTYRIDTLSDGRKAQLSYTMRLGKPWRYGQVEYLPMTPAMDSLIDATHEQSLLREGEQLSYASLVGERSRLFTLFREHGYYYFRTDMLAIEADTLQQRYRAPLRIGLHPALPGSVLRPWYIGDVHVSIEGGASHRAPIRSAVIAPRIAFSRGAAYSVAAQDATQRDLNRLGVFNAVSISYAPRDSVEGTDTLDVYIKALLERPYELSAEANLTAKSNDQVGPGAVLSLSRKNLFRLAETLQLRFTGSYEWQTRRAQRSEGTVGNSFELGTDVSMSVPQLLFPGGYNYPYRWPVSTTTRLYVDWLSRGGFFRMLAFGGNLTYAFSSSPVWTHSVAPFRLTFNTLEYTTHRFDSVMTANPAIGLSFRNLFVPATAYTATYDNQSRSPRHPSRVVLSLTSAGAFTSLLYAAAGQPLSAEGKTLMGTPYAQFLKGVFEACRYYQLTPSQQLATRLLVGVVYPYGNSRVAPYNEQFHVGGASDLRAFPLRGIGPGSYHTGGRYAYINRSGDLKLLFCVEWRYPLVGQLHGALFLDAGNVWLLREDASRPGAQFRWRTLGDDLALGTGVGLRYNLKMLLLRCDVGVPIHIPYATAKRGYCNVPHWGKGLCFHLGVGYPF